MHLASYFISLILLSTSAYAMALYPFNSGMVGETPTGHVVMSISSILACLGMLSLAVYGFMTYAFWIPILAYLSCGVGIKLVAPILSIFRGAAFSIVYLVAGATVALLSLP